MEEILNDMEACLEGVAKWKLITGTVTVTWLIICTRRFLLETDDLLKFFKKKMFFLLRKLPPVKKMIQKEMENAKIAIEGEVINKQEKILKKFHRLPEKGRTPEEVKSLAAEALSLGEYDWKDGKISGGVFAGRDESYSEFMAKIFGISAWTNPLHPDLFPGTTKMEAEIVKMTANIFHGDKNVVGTMTAGGTESLILMMKTYREWGRAVLGIKKPEVVVSSTTHAAIDKGADILGFRIRKVPIDSSTMNMSARGVSKMITSNTVLIVTSAPDFAYGAIDDIESISSLAKKKGIPLHVDCCLGGFILPFMEKAGFSLPPFNFEVSGVTSISADTHKYGCAPKGTSVLLYRSNEYRRHQFFAFPNWPGGVYASPTTAGSRPGSNIAMCWAAMLLHGEEGYVKITKNIISTARYLKKGFSSIPGLFVYGDPIGPVVAIGSNEFNIYQVSDVLSSKGWHLQPLQNPPGMHIFLTNLHTRPGMSEELVKDMRHAVNDIKNNPREVTKGIAKLYGLANSIPDKNLIGEVSNIYMDVYYSTPL